MASVCGGLKRIFQIAGDGALGERLTNIGANRDEAHSECKR